MNLTEELDRSFGSGPAHRPIEDRLAAGRRVVRRRRVATVTAAFAVVAAIGAVGVAVATGSDPSSKGNVATQPSGEPEEPEFMPGEEVRLDRDGTLLTREGVQVVREVENPQGLAPPDHSLGVVYTFKGDTYWALVTNSGSSTEVAHLSFPTFEYWLADQVALQKGDATLALVEFGDGESLEPRAGVEIISQTGDLSMMPSNFAGPNDRTAVAEVTYQGERWYVLARQIDGTTPEYFPTAASVSLPTLEQFLPYAADQYANGTGLR